MIRLDVIIGAQVLSAEPDKLVWDSRHHPRDWWLNIIRSAFIKAETGTQAFLRGMDRVGFKLVLRTRGYKHPPFVEMFFDNVVRERLWDKAVANAKRPLFHERPLQEYAEAVVSDIWPWVDGYEAWGVLRNRLPLFSSMVEETFGRPPERKDVPQWLIQLLEIRKRDGHTRRPKVRSVNLSPKSLLTVQT